MAENTKQFFQITEAARACGLSRSTLMRMEERGLLTPVFTAPDSGRRYYDNHNVARIMQIEKFKAMGLGSKEIADYFAQGGEAEVLLEALETRLRDLQRSVEEMRLRAADWFCRLKRHHADRSISFPWNRRSATRSVRRAIVTRAR